MKTLLQIIIEFIFGKPLQDAEEYYSPIEGKYDELIDLVNKERESRGLNILIPEKLLNEIAERKVNEMLAESEINHDGFLRRNSESKAVLFCENVAGNFKTQKAMFNAYMKSEKHRNNIIHPDVTHIGSCTIDKVNCNLFAKYK